MRKIPNEELGRPHPDDFRKLEKIPVIIVLDNVRSALNVGSVFRTADAFLVKAVYLCGITAQPPNRDILKTALGATQTVEWKYFGSSIAALQALKSAGWVCLAIEQAEGSTFLHQFKPQEDEQYALFFGHEVKGVSQEIMDMADGCIELPQSGTKHSLNIAVSVGIVAWHCYSYFEKLKPK